MRGTSALCRQPARRPTLRGRSLFTLAGIAALALGAVTFDLASSGLGAGTAVADSAAADGAGDALRPARRLEGPTTMARAGEQALERLPWDMQIVRTKIGAGRPAAIAAIYLMSQDLLVIEENGRVTCLARRDLQPKWMWTLSGSLHRPPAEGSGHYVFLVRAANGAYAVHALSRRTGVDTNGFPVRLPYGVSGGVGANAAMVWISALGSAYDNKTLTSLNLANGRPGWGWYTTGLLSADPVLDPTGKLLVVCGDDGVVMGIEATAQTPLEAAWSIRGLGSITATPAVTPDHLIVGGHDGLVRCIDIRSGEVHWMQNLGDAVKSDPWVLGAVETEERPTGVEGAPPIKVDVFKGLVFARSTGGLSCFNLTDGELLFNETCGGKPLVRQGKWVVTLDRNRMATLRDSSDGYKAKGRLNLGMFDLMPANETGGAIYGVTADGYLVAAVPR
jgi:outer membrane protein assembly factor BamB